MNKLDLWLKPYEILATGPRCGLIEVVSDALSLDSIRKKMGVNTRLIQYFVNNFGDQKSKSKDNPHFLTLSAEYKKARLNFCKSLAGYSLLCYLLAIKDRHNGNILIDIEGHILHIDFGFLLSNAPGKGIKFEKAPFKMIQDFVDVLGGAKSKTFAYFIQLLREGFTAV